jgi:hypothetical protein
MPLISRFTPAPLRHYPVQYALPYRQVSRMIRHLYPRCYKSEILPLPFPQPFCYQLRLIPLRRRPRCPPHDLFPMHPHPPLPFFKGGRVLFAVSKIQKIILDAFGIKYPL